VSPACGQGPGSLQLEASTVGQAVRELGRACPAVEESVLRPEHLHAVYKLSLNGERFVSDPETPLADGDVLLLLSSDMAG
jgi:sulfur-carrier protein